MITSAIFSEVTQHTINMGKRHHVIVSFKQRLAKCTGQASELHVSDGQYQEGADSSVAWADRSSPGGPGQPLPHSLHQQQHLQHQVLQHIRSIEGQEYRQDAAVKSK